MLTVIELAECRLLLDKAGYERWAIVESEKKDDRSFALVASDHERVPFWHCKDDVSEKGLWFPPRLDVANAMSATLLVHGWTTTGITRNADEPQPCANPHEAVATWLKSMSEE